jgi:hypothetical protein
LGAPAVFSLVITDEQFDEGLNVMEAALQAVCIHEVHEAHEGRFA